MEKKDRIICFTMSAIAIFLILLIVYINYKLTLYSLKDGYSPLYYPYVVYIISALLCSLLLQGEEILTIIRCRKSLLIRWELIILAIIALLLAFIHIWFPMLFPHFLFGETNYRILAVLIPNILVSHLWDVVYMLAAGIFFVRAFHVKGSLMEKKERIIWLTWSVLTIFFIVAIVYYNQILIRYANQSPGPYYRYYVPLLINIISAFSCFLLLFVENISTIIRRRKALYIHWELIALGIIALLLVILKICLPLLFPHSLTPDYFNIIIYSIFVSTLWDVVYMFAAGIFFVRAFYAKLEQIDLIDGELDEDKRYNSESKIEVIGLNDYS